MKKIILGSLTFLGSSSLVTTLIALGFKYGTVVPKDTEGKNNLLQKPDHVIEAPEVITTTSKPVQFETERPFSWSIGY